jgi:hypothetical protein
MGCCLYNLLNNTTRQPGLEQHVDMQQQEGFQLHLFDQLFQQESLQQLHTPALQVIPVLQGPRSGCILLPQPQPAAATAAAAAHHPPRRSPSGTTSSRSSSSSSSSTAGGGACSHSSRDSNFSHHSSGTTGSTTTVGSNAVVVTVLDPEGSGSGRMSSIYDLYTPRRVYCIMTIVALAALTAPLSNTM